MLPRRPSFPKAVFDGALEQLLAVREAGDRAPFMEVPLKLFQWPHVRMHLEEVHQEVVASQDLTHPLSITGQFRRESLGGTIRLL